MYKLIVIGAGGHAKVCIQVIRDAEAECEIVGCIANESDALPTLGVRVIGSDADLPRLRRSGMTHAFIAIGSNSLRERIYRELSRLDYSLPTFVHPSAWMSPTSRLDAGSIVMPKAVINAEAQIGHGAIINTSAIVEHDCQVAAFTHLAPGAILTGNVSIGRSSFVGANSTVIPKTRIGVGCVIGAGSTVIRDVEDHEVVAGNPARSINKASRSTNL